MASTTLQLLELGDGNWVAAKMTADEADQGEIDGLWTARGTVRVLSAAAAKREAEGR